MRLEHHLVGGYVRYISPHIIIIMKYRQHQYLSVSKIGCSCCLHPVSGMPDSDLLWRPA